MAKNLTIRADQDMRDVLDNDVDNGGADSVSEAGRQRLRRDMARTGDLNGTTKDTMLRRTVREASKIAIYPAIFALGITLFYPFAFRAPALVLIIAGLLLQGVDALLANVEPTVSQRMKKLVGVEA